MDKESEVRSGTTEKATSSSTTNSEASDEITNAGQLDFIIEFVNNSTGANQEHIDYEFAVQDEAQNVVFDHSMHSTYGIEVVKFKLDKPGLLEPQVIIKNILFIPVDPDVADFGKIIPVGDFIVD